MNREDKHFSINKKIKIKSCLSSIIILALECTIESPKEMINTKDEVARLKKIRNQTIDVKIIYITLEKA